MIFSPSRDETPPARRFLLKSKGQDLDAFQRQLIELLPRLRRFARTLARSASDADDLVQTCVERALGRRAQWTPGTRLDWWTMRIMKNAWIDETRSRSRRPTAFGDAEAL